jgi:cell division protein FtsI (penicillin-binding protein 3)
MMYIIITYGRLAFDGQKSTAPFRAAAQLERGAILDRNGKPLAVQTYFYHLALIPSAMDDLNAAADVLAPVTGLLRDEILERISVARTDFLYLKKKMTETEYETAYEAVQAARLNGIHFDKIPGRIYPENTLASQLIGFMGDDGKGLSGIEYAYQSVLAPKTSADPLFGINGNNVYLTIDANLQYKLEKLVSEALAETGGETIMLIAADSKNGDILSYVSLPSANLNEYTMSDTEERIDRPAVTAYEPGSVFKIFSVASFLDSGAIRDNDRFLCDGVYEMQTASGETIRINCLGHHGWLTARTALEVSCNDALCQMSEKIGAEAFISKLKEFGFGSRTGVELPSETNGSIKMPGDRLWSARSKPTISIGQEVAVSALQVVQATSALANGGTPIKLSLILKIADRNGRVSYVHQPVALSPVIRQTTADYLLSYMESAVQNGESRRAFLGDVSIGVKTGTAQMANAEGGGYSEDDFLSDCIAIFPVEDPKFILYIVLTKPRHGSIFASRNVAPVIADAANIIIDHFGLARPNAASFEHSGTIIVPLESAVLIGGIMPDLTDTPKRLLTPLLERADLRIMIYGDGYVARQVPGAGTPITENMSIELYLE